MLCNITQNNGDLNICSFTSRTTNRHLRNKIEWNNILRSVSYKHVNFLDPTNCWFLDSKWEQFVLDHTQNMHFDICIGTSMGAFAALKYSNIISADLFLLFAPQSFVNKQLWTELGEKHLLWSHNLDPDIDFKFTEKSTKNVKIVFSKYVEDLIHRERFIKLGYDIEVYNTENHTVAYTLALEDQLLEYVLNAYHTC
jgi:hypothetical protein